MTQVAKLTKIPKRTLYDMVKKQSFPVDAVPLTKPKKWRKKDIEAWINQD